MEIKQKEAAFMNTLRQFYAVEGMRGLVSILSAINESSSTGKLPDEYILKTICIMAALKFVESLDILKAEGSISLELKP
jgi:hypothetical protein